MNDDKIKELKKFVELNSGSCDIRIIRLVEEAKIEIKELENEK